MTTLRITVGNTQAGARFRRSLRNKSVAVRAAMRATANEAAQQIETDGRANIAGAGNFGARWTDGWKATVGEGGGFIRIRVTMGVPYWTVFQHGKVIQGKPLLWIPLSFATDAKGVRARDYPGQLFRVNRASGAPLLLTTGGEPKYFGKESVTIPKKFRLLEIVRKVSQSMRQLYLRNYKRVAKNG